ncbi:phospho-sugar mutase [Actinomadura verrucosospora]|uniref:Phosphoglucomutase/phosphomannomutase, C-terminal domain protein n=1 Tax=Actinomadura verrucosospora TaxID=46165 RepID=A0A7D3VXG5_ACTVE|nr:phospho-sugar mutase [Actinomadura verrucosospora]QKG25018.1 phosphoglucomutase/phosphomannomutase, C-terminal domain protein [Actinomadura verrucosospora]
MSDLRGCAEEWLDQDPDPGTRAELRAILDAGDDAALADRFGARLEFGTAGLRGELGAGPNRMNRVTVMRAAAGLAACLPAGGRVIVGFDARHGSRQFAQDTAAVLSGAGLRAEVFADPVPTPVLAHFTRSFDDVVAGVMVTASHNPPRDNGYKVYWADGAQIVPPRDAEISAAIDAVGRVDELPLGTEWTVHHDTRLYLDALAGLRLGDERDIAIVYTPMHGVGRDVLLAAFERAGFPAPAVVPGQADPDPDFPTVAFPNPEEPGALDLALALARDRNADLVIANDPDADRCAVAVPTADGWRALTGDEVGGLLAEHVLRHTTGDDRLVVTTIVSSSLLASIAREHGVRSAESLTGFKWIMKAGGPGDRLVFGYEEALGYSVGDDRGVLVNDKDGIGAALAVAALAAGARREGRTLLDLLDDQARRYGLHATSQLSVRVDDLSLIAGAMARLRADPPAELGGRAVEAFDDLSAGVDGLPPTDGLRFRLGGARVVVRPSGTEPKLKCYLEVVRPVDGDVADARERAAADLGALRADVSAALGLG